MAIFLEFWEFSRAVPDFELQSSLKNLWKSLLWSSGNGAKFFVKKEKTVFGIGRKMSRLYVLITM